jgi:hypothetical protein
MDNKSILTKINLVLWFIITILTGILAGSEAAICSGTADEA